MPRVVSNDSDPTDGIRILRCPQVVDRVGLSQPQIYHLVRHGKFPKPIPLSVNRVGWVESEIADWLKQRIAARDKPSTFQRGRRQPKRAASEAAPHPE